MNNHIRVSDEMFRTGIDLWFGDAPKIFGEISKPLNGRSLVQKEHNPCIWIRERLDFCTLIHEIIHCVSDIFDRRGINHNRETDELYAYMTQYYFKKFSERLLKSK